MVRLGDVATVIRGLMERRHRAAVEHMRRRHQRLVGEHARLADLVAEHTDHEECRVCARLTDTACECGAVECPACMVRGCCDTVCGECARARMACAGCTDPAALPWCDDCDTECAACGATLHRHCALVCRGCTDGGRADRYCPDCSVDCDRCGAVVCADCRCCR